MNRFSITSLRFRLFLLVLLATIPALGLILYTASEQRQRAATEIQTNALRLTRLAVAEQDASIEATHTLLKTLAQLPEVQDGGTEACIACSTLFKDLLKQYPSYTNICAANLDGQIYCKGQPPDGTNNVADRSFFRRAVQTGDFAIGDYQIGRAVGTAEINFGYPIRDDNGHLEGVVFAGLDLDWLDKFMAEAPLPPGSTMFAMDQSGIILARYPSSGDRIGRSLVDPAIIQTILSQGEGVTEAPGANGALFLFAFMPLRALSDANVYVTIGIPKETAFAEADWVLARNLISLGLVAVLALVATWVGGDLFIFRETNVLLTVTKRLSSGDLSARTGMHPNSTGELSQLARTFDQMAESLEQREAEHVQEGHARLNLLRKIISAQEDERNRIARELHDETVQSLTLLMMDLDLGRQAEATNLVKADRHFLKSRSIAEETLANLRRLIADLRPSMLDDLGLIPAITWYGEKRLKPLGISLQIRGNALEQRMPQAVETALFRIAQEALTNVAKHSNASRVSLTLEALDGHLTMQVEDDGKGFRVPAGRTNPAKVDGMGMVGIKERAVLLGGAFDLQTAPGKGTRITVRIPMHKEASFV